MDPLAPSTTVIGIRREQKSKFERRVPLTPDAVRTLVASGLTVLVQPSSKRVWRDVEYAAAGATVTEDLSPAGLILGVKEVPLSALLPGPRAYAFFAHVIKAQPAGMELLDTLLSSRIRLFDYEAFTVEGARGGKRLVAFGRFAGLAGVVDFFSGVGARFLSLGHSTPLLNIAQMYTYPSLGHALAAVREAGEEIDRTGLPEELCPLTLGVTGDGNVSSGAREVVEALGRCVRWVEPSELQGILANARGRERTHVVYATKITAQHMVRKSGSAPGAPFDGPHYKRSPEEYEPIFHEGLASALSLLAVCHFWEPRFPRLLTSAQTAELAARGALRLHGITDISADFCGAIEFGRETRPISAPFFTYNPRTDEVGHDLDAPGTILYHCVDHLPSECAREASEHFSHCLLPFMPSLTAQDLSKPVQEDPCLPAEVRGACITDGGSLTPNFAYIGALRAVREKAEAAAARRAGTPTAAPLVDVPFSFSPDIARQPELLQLPGGGGLRASARSASFLSLHVSGHVFDSGFINAGLDACESLGVDVSIVDVAVGRNRDTPSRMSLVLAAVWGGAGEREPGARLVAAMDALRALAAAKGTHLTASNDERAAVSSTATAVASGLASPSVGPLAALGLGLLDTRGGEGEGGIAVTPRASVGWGRGLLTPRPMSMHPPRRVLLLGAGLVAGPALSTLLSLHLPPHAARVHVTVASVIFEEAVRLIAGYGDGGSKDGLTSPLALDAANDALGLAAAVAGAEVVLSLLPATLHAAVAAACITARVHMVTASYVSPALAALAPAAMAAGIHMLHEMGLDPGIDHITAAALLHEIAARGGRVTSISSLCGGLPAPEAVLDNPLAYKFSWSPRGSLVAMQNDALYASGGQVVKVAGKDMLASARVSRAMGPAFALEVLPNRDSLPYAAKYGLGVVGTGGLERMFRGTLRYEGFSARMRIFQALGLLDAVSGAARGLPSGPLSLRALTAHCCGLSAGAGASDEEIAEAVHALGVRAGEGGADVLGLLHWAGLLDPKATAPVVRAPGESEGSWLPVDTLAATLSSLPAMSFSHGQRDLALMKHEVRAVFRSGQVEVHTATMAQYGEAGSGPGGRPSTTAMALTVGVTAAIGVELVLRGLLDAGAGGPGHGVHTPVLPAIFIPALRRLKEEGIALSEAVAVE
jgi:alpha-aminoadipic semialdehyde synthase